MRKFLSNKIILLFAVIFIFCGCEQKDNNSNHNSMNNSSLDAKAIASINTYISTNRGWKTTDYRVEVNRREGSLTVYTIIYLEDEKNPMPGGGKSFVVYYDPQKQAIIKELGFQ